jgi:perosamine synthetase
MIPWAKPKIFTSDKLFLSKAIKSSWISGGPFVNKFEIDLKKYLNVKYVSLCSNGTSALQVAFIALGLKPGDEIIIPAFGYLAAGNVALQMNLKVKFVDVNKETYCISFKDLKKKISNKTKAVIFIHTYGNTSIDLIKIYKYVKKKKIFFIEDAAEAFGSAFKNKKLGTIGDIGTFSFHATKNITTGEGGCIVTSDKKIAKKCKLIISHGVKKKRYYHIYPGLNYRLSNLQSSLGVSQLKKINKIISMRKYIYRLYHNKLKKFPKYFLLQKIPKNLNFVPWTFAINLCNFTEKKRDNLIKKMFKLDIELRNGFYSPNKLKIYRVQKNLLNSDLLSSTVITLPIYYDLSINEINKIIFTLKKILRIK